MSSLNDVVSVKEEPDLITEEENSIAVCIKTEEQCEQDNNLVNDSKEENDVDYNLQLIVPQPKVVDSPFQNIEIVVKKELPGSVDVIVHNIEVKKECDDCTGIVENNVQVVITNDEEVITNDVITNGYECDNQIAVKQEIRMDENVSYDFPNFDNTNMLSEEGADAMVALGDMQGCFQDGSIKSEHETESLDFHENIEDFPPPDIKLETGLTVTDTHLIPTSSNALLDGVDTKKLLVMKIGKNKNGLPKIILNSNGIQETFQNGYDPYLAEGYDEAATTEPDDFQLNSITGNVLTLEQQAFGVQNSKLISCHLCTRRFKTKCTYYRHIKLHETLERNVIARKNAIPKYKKTRALNKKLKEQKRAKDYAEYLANISRSPAKSDGYKCTCGKVFQRRSRMETCLRAHNFCQVTRKWLSCVTCKKQFKCKQELHDHRRKMHRKKFPCKFCPTDYRTKNELFQHLQIHQKVQLLEYKVISKLVQHKRVLYCVLCPQTYTELSKLKTHVMLDHKAPYTCPHCKNEFPLILDFINHKKSCHPDVEGLLVLNVLEAFSSLIQAWKCEECKRQFVEPDKLAVHQMQKHSPGGNKDAQFQCEHCRRVFVSQKALTSHKRVHHKQDSTEEKNDQVDGIMCLECRKMCKDMTALTSHMRLHSPDRKFPCKFCDFRFATKEKKKAHAEIHTGDMKYVCFICEYQCSSERRLKSHKRTPKHYDMQHYLLTGKPLEKESTSKQETSESQNKKAKKRRNVDERTESPKKRKRKDSREKKVEESSSSSDDGGKSDAEAVACDICGEEYSSYRKMQLHKQDHPFIEILADGQDKPERIFFK